MIPAACHFVWLGTNFPWLNSLAVVSAARQGRFDGLVLHVDDDLERHADLRSLRRLSGFELRRVDLASLAARAGESASRVRALYDNMTSAAARADVLRALILAGEGGVYLDLDTVTVAPFTRLRELGAFVGEEIVCFPEWSTRRVSLEEKVRAYGLTALRFGMRAVPRGYRWFARVAPWYRRAVNNAVLGSRAGHPFIRAYLEGMLSLPEEVARRRYAIGPDLLARVCREARPADFRILPPACFYPLGPVMSECWWSRTRRPDLADVLSDETVVVHWYASVRSRKRSERVDADYVRRHCSSQLFSRLAATYLDEF